MKRIKEDLEKMKGMSFKEAVDHIFTYYGLAIAGIIFGLIFIISLASTVITNKRTVPVISFAVQNEMEYYYSEDITSLLTEAFPDATGYHEPFKCTFSGAGDRNDVYAGIQLAAYIAAGDIDAILCDAETADYLGESGDSIHVNDISDTVLGKKAAEIGLTPLYYITNNEWKNAEAADRLLKVIRAQK